MASRIKSEMKNEPMELKPLGRRAQQPPRPPPPRPPPTRPGQSKAFVQPDVKPKIESKPLPEDPPGTYTDFVITSSGISEWRHDMMKFRPTNLKEVVNPLDWIRPVKLNRKELKKNYKTVEKVEPAKPFLGPDGKPVIGPDGKVVMVGGPNGLLPNGRPRPKEKEKGKDKEQPKRKFKRTKTRQVFRVSDEVRQLRREERHPWVLESGDGQQLWEGRLEDRGPQLQVLLFQSKKEGFMAVPLNKWYTFKEPPKHTILTLDQAEQLEKDMAKNSDIQRWMMRKTGGKVSEATQMTLKRESSAEPVRPRTTSDGSVLSRSGMRVLQVRTGNAADYGDNDDDGEGGEGATRRRRDRGGGGDGDYDEFEYEEEFQDDDEGAILPEDEEEDEETKALKEKEARLMRAANVVNDENRMDDDAQDEEEESDEDELNDAGKAMKKALRLWEKGAYADDDDDENKNPYLSSEDEEEEQEGTESGTTTPVPTGVLPQTGPTPVKPTPVKANGSTSKPPSRNISRASSPVPGRASNGITGAQMLAQRATSPPPGVNRVPSLNGQRALSPLAQEAGGRRASSPPRVGPSSSGGSLKRKAPDDVASPPSGRSSSPSGSATAASPGAPTTPNKRPRTQAKVTIPPDLVFEKAIPPGPIIAFLRIKPRTTGDCVKNFKDWFKEDTRNKQVLSFWIKQIAKLDNSGGEAVLKLHDDAKLAQMGIEF